MYYIGEYSNNYYDGLGLWHSYDDKFTFIGMWKQDSYSGEGILIRDSGAVISGIFENNTTCTGSLTVQNNTYSG